MNNIKNSFRLNKNTHNVRFGQALAPFGAGAMVDFKDQTLMAAAPEYWKEFQEIHDERLEKLLNVEKFNLPPDKDSISGLPFVRFPNWYFCPKCKVLKSLKDWEKDFRPSKRSKDSNMRAPKCMECNAMLVPAGIVIACEAGHIDDFPWKKWVHYRSKRPECNNNILKIKDGSSALGLEGLIVECKCGAKASLKGSFSENAFEKMEYRCTGNLPWKGKHVKGCSNPPKALQRGAMNIYFPKVVSSIVIPPYSSEINTLVEKSKKFSALLDQLKDEEYVAFKGKDNIISLYVDKIANEIHQDSKVIQIILNSKMKVDEETKAATKEEYRQEEYNALIGNIPPQCMNERDFKIEIQTNIDTYGIKMLSKVTLVKKLREVRALVGFSRLNPSEQTSMSGFDEDQNMSSGFIPIKEKETNWYPAYEARGEGIFIELDENQIINWIFKNPKVTQRVGLLNQRYNAFQNKNGSPNREVTPKFVLLHTIAHLLIKELSFECGYSSASLTERIFCNTTDGSINMSGILVYTASGDSEGTLGGLVRQGKSDMLPYIIRNAVKRATWCSSDPICIESTVQGRDGLNLSACHACTLISETSCEEFNVLLDRALIIGTLEDKKIGFFVDIL